MNYVMSDIHGNIEAFHSVLSQIDLQSHDSLYVLGDVIDRKKHGLTILQEIMEMPNAHMLLGNHEYMMMRALGFPYDDDTDITSENISRILEQWYWNGGEVTHEAWKSAEESTREKIKEYLKSLPLGYEIQIGDTLFKLMHAALAELYDELRGDEDYSRTYYSVWNRRAIFTYADNEFNESDGVICVFGHTPTSYFHDPRPLEIFHYKNVIGIDCGAGSSSYDGRLACLRLEDMKEFYS